MEKDYFQKYTIEQMRLQRHDFMNYLQVIFGYIQLNKPQDAINYIKNINKYMIIIGRVFNLESDAFGLIFQGFVNKCITHRIHLELDLRIEYISCEHFSKDIDKKRILFDDAVNKLLDLLHLNDDYSGKLYIYMDGLPESFNVVISSIEMVNYNDYFDCGNGEFLFHGLVEDNASCIFYKKDEITALKFNFD